MGKRQIAKNTKKNATKRSKSDKIVILVGLCIIAVAALITFLVIFVPKWMRVGDMEELLDKVTAPNAQSVVLVDMVPDGGNAMLDNAVQRELTGEELSTVMAGLAALAESGFSEAGSDSGWRTDELVLRVRTAEGEFVVLYFTGNLFYYYEGLQMILFEPDDAAAYAAFYREMESILSNSK